MRGGGRRRRRAGVLEARGGLCVFLSAREPVLVEAQRVAGFRRAAQSGTGRHGDGGRAAIGAASPERMPALCWFLGDLFGSGRGPGLVESVVVCGDGVRGQLKRRGLSVRPAKSFGALF